MVVCAGALVALFLVLGGSDEDSGKAVFVAIGLALFSLTGAAGMKLVRRGPEAITYLFGYVTVLLSAIAFGEFVATLWSPDWIFSGEGKTLAEIALATLAAANASLLLSTERPEDGPEVHGARIGGVISIAVLAILALVEISESGHDVGYKPMALFAILYVLCAVLVPLLRWADFQQR